MPMICKVLADLKDLYLHTRNYCSNFRSLAMPCFFCTTTGVLLNQMQTEHLGVKRRNSHTEEMEVGEYFSKFITTPQKSALLTHLSMHLVNVITCCIVSLLNECKNGFEGLKYFDVRRNVIPDTQHLWSDKCLFVLFF